MAYQPVAKLRPRCERTFSADFSLETLDDSRTICGISALIRRKILRSRGRRTFTTGCYRLGVDVGGTFTDLLLVQDDSGDLFRVKTPSTPADPSQQILFNDGFYPLLHVIIPDGSLLHPKFPAALGCRTHALTRLFDVLGGALARNAPELNTAAGYGTSPYMLYSGWDKKGEFFYLMEISYGGIPGRPIGDGMDGHSWWPLFENTPTEYLEPYYPLRIDGYTTVEDSGGVGFHRGGAGIEKRYVYLEPGEVSIHDDRWLTYPWDILGGKPGRRSEKLLVRADGSRPALPSKCDEVRVEAGDTLVYRTVGGGGRNDPLNRPYEKVAADVAKGLVSEAKARSDME